ncbi:hypothetical protein B0I32_1329 [Nonomuraea fuscirosea]|uniref:Protein kinase domain-containing protein n=1 Tax=Nonomuraea fuscirosea TaxID=1291556 RepID=A0A2T0M4Y9_9ACTN|nr:hypothetical protein [Nonomuraea fuscirosea]PRX52259.1 hypothetical protein B0I32_1329 [Nonomuraea fuscirosea]
MGEGSAYLPEQVSLSELVLQPGLSGVGGQAMRVVRCLGPDAEEYLYKEYTEEVCEGLRPQPMKDLVSWRRRLTVEERAELDRRCAWPMATVVNGGKIRGILITPAPADMYEDDLGDPEPRHLDVLARKPDVAFRVGAPYYESPVKLAVLAVFFDTMLWLHRHGYAIGDLHPHNALFSFDGLAGEPRVLLIDCDSCVPMSGIPAFAPQDPEIWKMPGLQSFGPRSDLYKFGWMVVRCLQENLESVSLQRHTLLAVMRGSTYELLSSICAGQEVPGAAGTLRGKAALWRSLISSQALYVQNDDHTRAFWLPRAVTPDSPTRLMGRPPPTGAQPSASSPAPVPYPVPPPAPVPPPTPYPHPRWQQPVQRKSSSSVLPVVVLVALVLVVILVILAAQ